MKFTGGLPETACGYGSTLAGSVSVREHLPGLLAELGVTRLLDAPCGDFNWMRHVDLGGIEYIGCDVSAPNLSTAWSLAKKDFRFLDIVTSPLPSADAMLCRDFHQHLPDDMVMQALWNWTKADIEWLIATSHDSDINLEISNGFRPLNLTKPPFSLPEPRRSIGDGPGRILGVWHRNDFA